MGTDGVACGWLIMPSWFYAETVGGIATDSESDTETSQRRRGGASAFTSKRKAMRSNVRSGTSSSVMFRSKAHRRQSQEKASKASIRSAARRLLQTMRASTNTNSSSGSPGGLGEDSGFLASFARATSNANEHECSGAQISPDTVLTTASCSNKLWPAGHFDGGDGDGDGGVYEDGAASSSGSGSSGSGSSEDSGYSAGPSPTPSPTPSLTRSPTPSLPLEIHVKIAGQSDDTWLSVVAAFSHPSAAFDHGITLHR
jgi:hypothetical protein